MTGIKALYTYGQAVDAGAVKVGKFLLFKSTWVGFKGDLDVPVKANYVICGA